MENNLVNYYSLFQLDRAETTAALYGKLEDKFVVPPFTILDTRQGYWRERKEVWRQLIQDFGERISVNVLLW